MSNSPWISVHVLCYCIWCIKLIYSKFIIVELCGLRASWYFNFLEMFTLDIVILFCCYQFQTFCFREWNGVEVDCIIKRKKTNITENNIQQAFIYFVRWHDEITAVVCNKFRKRNLIGILCVCLLKRTYPVRLLEFFSLFLKLAF